jgi:hypothetical protein
VPEIVGRKTIGIGQRRIAPDDLDVDLRNALRALTGIVVDYPALGGGWYPRGRKTESVLPAGRMAPKQVGDFEALAVECERAGAWQHGHCRNQGHQAEED